MQALRAGAVDYVPKPAAAQGGMADPRFGEELRAKISGWARMRRARGATRPAPPPASLSPAPLPARARPGLAARPLAIAIGCSTGGPQALAALVGALTRPPPVPVLVVQHMPAGFTALLADHLNRLGRLPCSEAQDGEAILPGRLYLAPGEYAVAIISQEGLPEMNMKTGRETPAKSRIPEKYTAVTTSGLRVTFDNGHRTADLSLAP
jgi:two-component system chemotaxis response regulator CheB